eukprot:scaffold439_cov415-Prasinococcus_capsulatus_cf.AAC.47
MPRASCMYCGIFLVSCASCASCVMGPFTRHPCLCWMTPKLRESFELRKREAANPLPALLGEIGHARSTGVNPGSKAGGRPRERSFDSALAQGGQPLATAGADWPEADPPGASDLSHSRVAPGAPHPHAHSLKPPAPLIPAAPPRLWPREGAGRSGGRGGAEARAAARRANAARGEDRCARGGEGRGLWLRRSGAPLPHPAAIRDGPVQRVQQQVPQRRAREPTGARRPAHQATDWEPPSLSVCCTQGTAAMGKEGMGGWTVHARTG